MPVNPPTVTAITKTFEGQTFRLEAQPKNVNCCAGCDVDRFGFQCSDFIECTKTSDLDNVWKLVKP